MFLLDTNVISELRSGKPKQSRLVRAWAQHAPANQLYLSSITVLELEIGVQRMERKDVRQGRMLRTWVQSVLQQFDGQMLPFTGATAQICAGAHVPDPASYRDSMIAAIAQQHGFTLVTRHTADFASMKLSLLNPWEPQV